MAEPPRVMNGMTKARLRNWLERVLGQHPAFWVLAGALLFAMWGGLVPRIRWNAEEMMIARNLLHGRGLVMAPLDPPSLGRPLLGVFLCAAAELFTDDPYAIYRVIYAVSLTLFLLTSFYTAKALWEPAAAHLTSIFILTSPALTTRLACHIHGMSHIAFLAAIGPALWCSVRAFRNPARRWLFLAGVCWGLTYLARWESLLLFAVTAGVLLYAQRRPAAMGALLLGFALLCLPDALYQHWAKAHYGIWGPSAISTFYSSEAWVHGTGDEDLGFARAEQLYGSLEANRFSLLRAMARNPSAVWARLRVNVPRFLQLFEDRRFFDAAWLILAAALVLDLALARTRRVPLTWLGLMFVCSTSVCLLHIDVRYAIAGIPAAMLILCGGVTCLGNRVQRTFGRGKAAAMVACIVVLGLRCGGASYAQFRAAERDPARAEGQRTVAFARGIARHFIQAVHPGRPMVLVVHPDTGSGMNQTDMFLVSYFAGTAIAWPPPVHYRRDKIFSMVPKEPDYVYLPRRAGAGGETPIAEYRSPWGDYDPFRQPAAK